MLICIRYFCLALLANAVAFGSIGCRLTQPQSPLSTDELSSEQNDDFLFEWQDPQTNSIWMTFAEKMELDSAHRKCRNIGDRASLVVPGDLIDLDAGKRFWAWLSRQDSDGSLSESHRVLWTKNQADEQGDALAYDFLRESLFWLDAKKPALSVCVIKAPPEWRAANLNWHDEELSQRWLFAGVAPFSQASKLCSRFGTNWQLPEASALSGKALFTRLLSSEDSAFSVWLRQRRGVWVAGDIDEHGEARLFRWSRGAVAWEDASAWRSVLCVSHEKGF